MTAGEFVDPGHEADYDANVYDIVAGYHDVEATQDTIYPGGLAEYNQFTVPQLETIVDFWAFLKVDGVQNERGSILQRA